MTRPRRALLPGLLPMASLASFLIDPNITSPGIAGSRTGLDPPSSITNEDAFELELMEAFSQLGFPFTGL